MYWMKNAWASRSSIQSIPRTNTGRHGWAEFDAAHARRCRQLESERLHVGFLLSFLTLNLAASPSNSWQPRRSLNMFDLVVNVWSSSRGLSCSQTTLAVTYLLRSLSCSLLYSCAWQTIILSTHLWRRRIFAAKYNHISDLAKWRLYLHFCACLLGK